MAQFHIYTRIDKTSPLYEDVKKSLIGPSLDINDNREDNRIEIMVDIEKFNEFQYFRIYNEKKNEIYKKLINSLDLFEEKLNSHSTEEDLTPSIDLYNEIHKTLNSNLYIFFRDIIINNFFKKISNENTEKVYLNIGEELIIGEVESSGLLELAQVYCYFLKHEKKLLKLFLSKQASKMFEQFINEIPRALVVFNSKKELFLHNKAFRNLNILSKDVLNYADGLVEIDGSSFNLSKFQLDSGYKLYAFDKTVTIKNNYDDELGIITGSIAHELNNPIAGILSGVEAILALSENIDDESKEMFHEVKKSGVKSKDLINTFLGFYKSSSDFSQDFQVKVSIDQAYDFIRTRLIESDLKLKLNVVNDEVFLTKEKALWTMIFYLIFTNCINLFLRDQLIRGKKHNTFELDLSFFESNLKISFKKLNFIGQMYNEINRSPFFHYLLARDRMELSQTDNYIEIFKA